MDKYTVDLDQVLNDFEYSELTDHYTRTTSSDRPPVPLQQTSVTKHSINNVFHSLNEYLNTSISEKHSNLNVNEENNVNFLGDFQKIDNNLKDNKENVYVGEKNLKVLNCNQNVTKNKSQNEFKSISQSKTDKQLFDSLCSNEDTLLPDLTNSGSENNDKINHIEPLIVDIKFGTDLSTFDGPESSFNVSEEATNLKEPLVSEDDTMVIGSSLLEENKPHFVTHSPDSLIDNSENVTVADSVNVKVQPLVCSEDSFIDNTKNTDTAQSVMSEDQVVCSKDRLLDNNENFKHIEDSNIATAIKEANDDHLPVLNEDLVVIEDERSHPEAVIEDLKDTIEKTADILKDLKVTGDSNDSSIDCHSVSNELKTDLKKIGFTEDLELDENELNKMLEELDDEDDEFKDCDTEETLIKENNELNGILETMRTDLERHDETIILKQDEELLDVKETTVTIDSNVTKEENAVEEDIAVIDQVDEQNNRNEMLESGVIDTKENEKLTHDIGQEYGVEVLQEEICHESLSRPHDLPLNNDVPEKIKRKIDLIGDPGSTPYNNVYVSKSIPKQQNKQTNNDSDTEYSTSASPTFSDISTESTSTASTLSVEDSNVKVVKENNEEKSEGSKGGDDAACVENVDERRGEAAEYYDETKSQIPSENVEQDIATGMANEENAADLEESHAAASASGSNTASNVTDKSWLGKEAPLWIPDSDAIACLHCDMKFTVIKRRHHCRACGLVLCSKCCNLRMKLEYLDAEARVCGKCHDILNKDANSSSGSEISPEAGNSPAFRPNPNNPLEYCSTVSPLEQVGAANSSPPSVMVPVGVLKRKGSNKSKSNKSVMFCDGIKPGSDLTNLDNDFNYNNPKPVKKTESEQEKPPTTTGAIKVNKNTPKIEPETKSFIPNSESSLPPTVTINKTDVSYTECSNTPSVVEMLRNESLTFALQVNLYVHVRIINMNCCINKIAWCFTTEGLINVGNDEIVILLEFIDGESLVPKELFSHLNQIYLDALKGVSTREMGISLHNTSNFLDSKNHAGFVYVRPTFQCLENVIKPNDPFLIGILIHRWETPWAKLFPLRLVLRLGAEYRYYPSPVISTRHRDSVFVEVGHTIINLLADFRNFSYTLPQIRGLIIHMEDKKTTVTIPTNRYDLVMKSINNSSDHILAFAGNFSRQADSHLVCIQDTQSNDNSYSTHAINIHDRPRKVTGASFIVFNGALKSSSGLTAKSNIVEDGLMIQVLPEHMALIRDNLRAMKNHTIACGCVNATSDETVNIVWGENDSNFNTGVTSPIDNMAMSGIPSIRVHNGKDYISNSGSRLIRWTEVFILQNSDETSAKNQDPVDISKISESIAKATSNALVKYIDLLVSNSFYKIAIRTTLHVENVSYSAGSNGVKLPPIYMKSLDNELIPVLHRITSNNLGDNAIVLELIFRILNV